MPSGIRSRNPNFSKKDLQKEVHKRLINKREETSGYSASLDTFHSHSQKLEPWMPGSYIALKALISARLCSAIWGIINDCDETYNFWEPTHYLLYGKGFQTWEYSPEYALRSYLYVLLHVAPAYFYAQILQSNRMLVFFFIRCLLALGCAGCELYFYRGICKEFGANIGRIALGLMVFSAGMFIASTAYLPSSFAMYMSMLAMGAWFQNSLQLAIFATALATFVGWPFAAALGVPIAFDILIWRRKYILFVKWCCISAAVILVPMVQIDSHYFARLVVAPLNIVIYNVFSKHGPNLYGTEPVSFYLFNGFLNFNICFLAALISLPFCVLCYQALSIPKRDVTQISIYLALSPLYLWFSIFFFQPHKEERFLFPVFPLICFAASITVDTLQKSIFSIFVKGKRHHYLHYMNWLALLFVVLSGSLGIMRTIGQLRAYRAPFETFLELNRLDNENAFPSEKQINVCVGREWHRYPSSFFLPGLNWNLQFIESEFRGQLPKPYSNVPNATSVIPTNMNDANNEETSRYVPLSSCHFLIDLDREETTPREPRYSQQVDQWTVIYKIPFLDSGQSPRLFRSFYIPFLTESRCSYVDYVLMQSKNFDPPKIPLG